MKISQSNLLILILWAASVTAVYFTSNSEKQEAVNKYKQTELVVDSLNKELVKLSSERDTIKDKIIVTKTKLKTIKVGYEKELISITNQSIADDVHFFTEYISKVDSGLPSGNNPKSTKSN